MKTIIHIGQHKTATTSIQKYLQDNRRLIIKKGLYVPDKIAGFKNSSHFILNVYALDKNRFSSKKYKIISSKGQAYLSGLKEIIKRDIAQIYQDALEQGCHQVIWSNEGLYLLNSVAEYQKLINLFTPYSTEIEVICCFREVQSYRESYIKQLKKQNISLLDDPDSYRYLEPDSWLFDYERKKNLLEQTFSKCHYFSYDSSDNVTKFMKVIGFDYVETEKYRLNETNNKSTKNTTLLNRLKNKLKKSLALLPF